MYDWFPGLNAENVLVSSVSTVKVSCVYTPVVKQSIVPAQPLDGPKGNMCPTKWFAPEVCSVT